MEERERRDSAPGSCVHCVRLKIISQSSPRLSRAPPRFCPGCSLCRECLSLSSRQLVLKGSADVWPPLTAPGRSRGCAVWLHRASCVPLLAPNSWRLEEIAFNMSALYIVTPTELGDSSKVEEKVLSWEVGVVGSSPISCLDHAV